MIRASSRRPSILTTVPQELSGAVPREVQLTGGGVALVAIAAALALGAVVLGVVLTVTYRNGVHEAERREREAVPAVATVTSVVVRRGDDNDRTIIRYSYEVDRSRFAGILRVSRRQGQRFAPGSPLAIEYLRSEPGRHWVAGQAPRGTPVVLIPVAVFSALLGAAAVLWALRRQWQLLAEGRVVLARVTRVVKDKQHGTYRLSLEFETLSGATRTPSTVVGKNPPTVGATVPVLYHRERTQWIAVYPLRLVRPLRGIRPQVRSAADPRDRFQRTRIAT